MHGPVIRTLGLVGLGLGESNQSMGELGPFSSPAVRKWDWRCRGESVSPFLLLLRVINHVVFGTAAEGIIWYCSVLRAVCVGHASTRSDISDGPRAQSRADSSVVSLDLGRG